MSVTSKALGPSDRNFDLDWKDEARLEFDYILDVFEDLFRGSKHIVRNCIKRMEVVETDTHPVQTMAVDANGVFYVRRTFWDEHVKTGSDLKFLLMHELMHHITGDVNALRELDPEDPFFMMDKECMNVAMDARINAWIHKYMPFDSADFLEDFYKDAQGPFAKLLHPGLVDPPSEFDEHPELWDIYQFLYYDADHADIIGFKDIYEILLGCLPPRKVIEFTVVLGGHDNPDPSDPSAGGTLNDIPEELKEAVEDLMKSQAAGKGDKLHDTILNEVQNTGERLNTDVFKHLGFDHLFRNIRAEIRKYNTRKAKAAVPRTISKGDFFRIAMGAPPFMWDVEIKVPTHEKICAPIYLDVSGSMISYLPQICGVIAHVDSNIDFVWGFSNEVHQHNMEDLREGKLRTTYGTDFDCVVEHAMGEGFQNIVLITDGYAWLHRNTIEEVKEKIKECIVIILDDGYCDRNNVLSEAYGKTYTLNEVTV